MNFSERVAEVIQEKSSLLCVGLDPDIRRIPACLKGERLPLFKFCQEIMASTAEFAAAFKPNFAFFEVEGSLGWAALEDLTVLMPADTLKLADAKRGDIGSTSEMYARAIFQELGFDAVTVNPYLGRDAVEPFLQWPEKGAFILGVTSNPGANDFQKLQVDSQPLYQKVITEVNKWNVNQNCGLVVGATHPDELSEVRKMVPDLPFLIPGIGAQGGDLKDGVMNGTDEHAGMALFNASRSIIYKSSGSDFAEAAAQEAERLRDEMNEVRSTKH